jgi:hypothetical protein
VEEPSYPFARRVIVIVGAEMAVCVFKDHADEVVFVPQYSAQMGARQRWPPKRGCATKGDYTTRRFMWIQLQDCGTVWLLAGSGSSPMPIPSRRSPPDPKTYPPLKRCSTGESWWADHHELSDRIFHWMSASSKAKAARSTV